MNCILKNISYLLSIFTLCNASIVSKSKIDEITVYNGFAEVRRTFTVDSIDEGYSTIVLSDLPSNSLDDSTIRLNGIGTVVILSTTIERQTSPRNSNHQYIELLKKLNSIAAELKK